jgi:hypothetical protein
MTVALAPAPVIVSGAMVLAFRSPLVLSSAPTGAIERVYRPERSTIVFDLLLTLPQSVRFDGTLTASMASRSEHLPS